MFYQLTQSNRPGSRQTVDQTLRDAELCVGLCAVRVISTSGCIQRRARSSRSRWCDTAFPLTSNCLPLSWAARPTLAAPFAVSQSVHIQSVSESQPLAVGLCRSWWSRSPPSSFGTLGKPPPPPCVFPLPSQLSHRLCPVCSPSWLRNRLYFVCFHCFRG